MILDVRTRCQRLVTYSYVKKIIYHLLKEIKVRKNTMASITYTELLIEMYLNSSRCKRGD